MLIATFKDANNTLVHLATVICDKENSDNYSFLYALMRKNSYMEEVLDSDKTTIYTDQHQSHSSALYLHARHAVSKWCLRHFITNLDQEVAQVSLISVYFEHGARSLIRAWDAVRLPILDFRRNSWSRSTSPARHKTTNFRGKRKEVVALI